MNNCSFRCYVGPARTQWRKCSDKYFPYVHNIIHKLDHFPTKPWYSSMPLNRPGARPDRPPAPPIQLIPRPSLDEYEVQFDEQFLEPPKPGKKLSYAFFLVTCNFLKNYQLFLEIYLPYSIEFVIRKIIYQNSYHIE